MAIFKKNPNEKAYYEGKKHIQEVLKNTGPADALIWRQPEEDFNDNSTLIVMPGEEAIFVNGGVIVQTFENGTYTLTTQNYPFISRLRNVATGGISKYNCVVYYVRKAKSLEILWGTDSPVKVRDKMLQIETSLRARGAYKVQIDQPAVLLEQLLGSKTPLLRQNSLSDYFIQEFRTKIKSVIARAILESDTEILGIDARLDELSEIIHPYMQKLMEPYGLRCVSFVISAIDIADDRLRHDFDRARMSYLQQATQADAEKYRQVSKAEADKAMANILGGDFEKVKGMDLLNTYANKPDSAANLTNLGVNLGMGIGVAKAASHFSQQLFDGYTNPSPQPAPQPQAAPQAAPADPQDPMVVLKKLKALLDEGLIEPSEYQAKKEEILKRL